MEKELEIPYKIYKELEEDIGFFSVVYDVLRKAERENLQTGGEIIRGPSAVVEYIKSSNKNFMQYHRNIEKFWAYMNGLLLRKIKSLLPVCNHRADEIIIMTDQYLEFDKGHVQVTEIPEVFGKPTGTFYDKGEEYEPPEYEIIDNKYYFE